MPTGQPSLTRLLPPRQEAKRILLMIHYFTAPQEFEVYDLTSLRGKDVRTDDWSVRHPRRHFSSTPQPHSPMPGRVGQLR